MLSSSRAEQELWFRSKKNVQGRLLPLDFDFTVPPLARARHFGFRSMFEPECIWPCLQCSVATVSPHRYQMSWCTVYSTVYSFLISVVYLSKCLHDNCRIQPGSLGIWSLCMWRYCSIIQLTMSIHNYFIFLCAQTHIIYLWEVNQLHTWCFSFAFICLPHPSPQSLLSALLSLPLTDMQQPFAAHYVNSPGPGCQLLMSPMGLFNLGISAGWDEGEPHDLSPQPHEEAHRGRTTLVEGCKGQGQAGWDSCAGVWVSAETRCCRVSGAVTSTDLKALC